MGKTRSIDGQDAKLIESIDRLRQEVEVLRNAVDDLREELRYLVRNPGESCVTETIKRLHVTSLPLDPSDDDFGLRINAVPAETVAELRTSAETIQEENRGPATSQRDLF